MELRIKGPFPVNAIQAVVEEFNTTLYELFPGQRDQFSIALTPDELNVAVPPTPETAFIANIVDQNLGEFKNLLAPFFKEHFGFDVNAIEMPAAPAITEPKIITAKVSSGEDVQLRVTDRQGNVTTGGKGEPVEAQSGDYVQAIFSVERNATPTVTLIEQDGAVDPATVFTPELPGGQSLTEWVATLNYGSAPDLSPDADADLMVVSGHQAGKTHAIETAQLAAERKHPCSPEESSAAYNSTLAADPWVVQAWENLRAFYAKGAMPRRYQTALFALIGWHIYRDSSYLHKVKSEVLQWQAELLHGPFTPCSVVKFESGLYEAFTMARTSGTGRLLQGLTVAAFSQSEEAVQTALAGLLPGLSDIDTISSVETAPTVEQASPLSLDPKSAFSRQEGGRHYKSFPIEPIQFAMQNGYDACAASILKYLCRHSLKDGLMAFKKARHYVELRMELLLKTAQLNVITDPICINTFLSVNRIPDLDGTLIRELHFWVLTAKTAHEETTAGVTLMNLLTRRIKRIESEEQGESAGRELEG